MPKPALNNRNNRINVYGRVIAHDIFVNQGVSNNDSPTFASLYLTGDATVAGNLYVEGNTAILNTNIMEFEDNIILINSQETGNGVTLNQAGFEIERGTLENYRFAFRETDLNFRIGMVSNMQAVATREDNPLLNGIMTWNNTQKRLDSSNTINIPIITFQSTVNSTSSSTGSIILGGGIGIRRDIFTDGRIFMGGSTYNKRSSIFTNQTTNNLVLSCDEQINLTPRTGVTIPTNVPFVIGDSNKFIRSNPSNNMDITCDGDINLNLGFSKRLVIPNLSSIVFSTDNEKIFTDGFNNLIIQCSEDIQLKPLTNKKILIPNDIPIAFSNTSQQIRSNASNDLIITAGRNITFTPNLSVRINSTVPSNSITSGAVILTGGMGMSGNLNVGGNLSVIGDLNILGTTTTVNTETLLVKDNLVVLNNAPAALADGGILIKRYITGTSGSVNYAAAFYKESTDEFTFALTNSDSSITPLTITNYLPIRADSIVLLSTSGNSIDTAGDVNIGKNLFITGPTLKIPVGDTVSRPLTPLQGSIRYNSEYSQFEGFGAGNAWGSLGGVVDIAQTTKILASASPGTTDGNLYFYNIGVESVRINSTGNVGIGTTSPTSKLYVNGTTTLTDGVTAGSLSISSTQNALSHTSGAAIVVEGGVNVKKNLFIGGPGLKIPSGDTASRPDVPIHGYVRFNTQTEQFEGFGAGDTWGSLGGVIDVNQDTKILAEESPGANDDNLRFFTNGIENMRINSAGNIGIGTTSPNSKLHVVGDIFTTGEVTVLSDVRYKTNIETIDGALDKVNKIRGVYFNRKTEEGVISSRNVGVIANEIEKVLPEVVYEKNSIKTVAYQNIIGLLIEAVKELKSEVNELRKQNNS